MTEEQAIKKARKAKGDAYVFRLGSSWTAAWDWVVLHSRKWERIKQGKLKIDHRTMRRVA